MLINLAGRKQGVMITLYKRYQQKVSSLHLTICCIEHTFSEKYTLIKVLKGTFVVLSIKYSCFETHGTGHRSIQVIGQDRLFRVNYVFSTKPDISSTG